MKEITVSSLNEMMRNCSRDASFLGCLVLDSGYGNAWSGRLESIRDTFVNNICKTVEDGFKVGPIFHLYGSDPLNEGLYFKVKHETGGSFIVTVNVRPAIDDVMKKIMSDSNSLFSEILYEGFYSDCKYLHTYEWHFKPPHGSANANELLDERADSLSSFLDDFKVRK